MSVLFEKTFPVAAVCDRRSEPTPALIERRYSASRSFVAAVCDCRLEENHFTKA